MARQFDIFFGEGVDESADRLALPDGKLAFSQNVRPDRMGRLEVRPSHTALATDVYGSGTLTAYDLANYRGRLTALGTRSTADVLDLFEFVDSAATWRGSRVGTPAFGILTDVRATGRSPLLTGGVLHADLASDGTQYLCAVAALDDDSAVIHVFDPATDQTILLTQVADLVKPRVAYSSVNDDFFIFGIDGDDDLVYYTFSPSNDEALSSATTVQSSATTCLDLSVGTGVVSGTNGFVVAVSRNGVATQIYLIDGGGTTINNWSASTMPSSMQAIAVMGNDAADRVIFAGHDIAGDDGYDYIVYNHSGSVVTAKTQLFGVGVANSIAKIAMGYDSSGDTVHVSAIIFSSPTTFLQHSRISGADFDTVTALTNMPDAYLTTRPVVTSLATFAGAQDAISAQNDQGTNLFIALIQGALSNKLPQVAKDTMIASAPVTASTLNDWNGAAVIGSKVYWVTRTQTGVAPGSYRVDGQTLPTYQVNEARVGNTGRRQMAEICGELYISGGVPMRYDGRVVSEQGFFERPQIISLAQSDVGGTKKTETGTYRVRVVWSLLDARGNVLRSSASGTAADILTGGGRTITLTGTNDTITVTATTPHSWLTGAVLEEAGTSVRVEAYCTTAGGENFFFETAAIVPSGGYGDPITLTLDTADSTLETQPTIYLQGQTPLPHHAPEPYSYTWAGRERQVIGGTPELEFWFQSKLLFPGEPIEFAAPGRLGFSGRISREVKGVAAFDNAAVVFTEDSIWLIPGRGPEHDGSGDFDAPIQVASAGGLHDWRSLVSTPVGLMFQMAPDKLMLLSRPGSDPSQIAWVGEAIQDTLAAYPVIVGAAHLRNAMLVAFGCTNTAGDASRLLIYDLSNGQWSVETTPGVLSSVTEYQGRLAMVVAGTVYREEDGIGQGAGALPTMRIETGSFKIFGGNGWGDLMNVVLSFDYVGDCNVEGFVSYDDGVTWTTMGDKDVTSSSDETLEFEPKQRECARFAIRFDVTNASDTGGVRLRMMTLEADAEEFVTRQPAGNQR